VAKTMEIMASVQTTWHYKTQKIILFEGKKVKLSLCSTKWYAMNMHREVEV
jgi:hypothetical protein